MKKKIIQIGGNLRLNGISSFIMTLYRNLQDDYQFIFINTAQGKDYYRKEIETMGGKVYDVVVKGKGLIRALRQAKKIREIIRKEKPIAVHSHYYSNNGMYLKQAYLEGVPVRISHCHQSNPSGLTLGKRVAKYLSAKMVGKYATHAFACSDAARNFLYGNGGEVCYNAVDYQKFKPANENIYDKYGLDKNKRYFLFVGRFTKQKNVGFLISLCEAMKKNESVRFMLVGYGRQKESIERAIAEKCLNNVTILPPDSNVPELLSVSSAFLLPSLYEGLPITLIEAQAVGVRCLVSDVVTKEVQLGLIEYLPLTLNVWKDRIEKISDDKPLLSPKKSILFDDKYQAALFDGIYSAIDSDEWVKRGKEYSIGSKRFIRSKELSFASFKMAHSLGNVRGTFYYALAIFEGNGTDKDKDRANELVTPIVSFVEQKANKNIAEYVVILADMYSFGLGKSHSFERAYDLYQKAAELGNLEAMCDLGYMYLVGQGVEIDKAKSAYWYKKSADLGYVHSMRDIGQSYLYGEGVDKNGELAVKYFSLACENNYSHGTTDLAYCYLNGIGVNKDLTKAKDLYLVALRQDIERTMRDLIALDISVDNLLFNDKLVLLNTTDINKVSSQNFYSGTVYVSEKITEIDTNCFYAESVKKIFVEKGNPFFAAMAGVLFNKAKTTLLRFPPQSPETSYSVPSGVTVIGKHAFQNARNLTEIILPDTLITIEDSAFDDCKNLKKIIIPNTVTSIGAWAFHGCDKITTIMLSKNINSIGLYAFGSCESLELVEVDKNNADYCSNEGNLYTKDMRVLIQYAIAKKDDTFTLPTQTEKISFRAVSDAYHLKQVDLKNVQVVENKAFYYATSLEHIVYCDRIEFGENVFGFASEKLTKEVRK